MKSIGEFFALFSLFFKMRSFAKKEKIWVESHFYSCEPFRNADLALKKLYRFTNPYSLCRKVSNDVYGETPLATFVEMFERGGLSCQDRFVDLGAGRGRGVIFAASVWGCVSLGIDLVPDFCHKANQAGSHLPVYFLNEDFTTCNLPQGTFFYLYAITMEEPHLQKILEKLSSVPSGTKIVTVDFPLEDAFQLIDSWESVYPWGTATMYLQIKKVPVALRN